MDAVEFFEEKQRMCDWSDDNCSGCEIHDSMNNLTCRAYIFRYPEKAIEIVERWSKAHPRKTRQSEFLKMFPRVGMDADGIVEFCPMSMDLDFPCPARQNFDNYQCPECRKKYWLEEVGE